MYNHIINTLTGTVRISSFLCNSTERLLDEDTGLLL